ncbi:MAG TPA: hypothetical protein VGH07_08050, partial [Chthoniobacterales bacterium]
MSDRKKIILAIIGSLVLHVIIILGLSKVIALWPDVSIPPQKPDESPPELTVLDEPAPDEQKQQQRQYLRTNDDQKTDKKPDNAEFESDKDTAAASEKPATGTQPVPTQEGKDLPDIGFKNEDSSLAQKGATFAHDPGDAPDLAQAQPQDKKQEAPQQEETPTPAPTPPPTPVPTPTPPPT